MNRLHDAFKNFRRLRSDDPRVSAPIKDGNGVPLSDLPEKLERWSQYFGELLNRPPAAPSASLAADSANAKPSPLVSCEAPSLLEVHSAIGALKMGKAAGVCGVSPEMFKFGEPYTSRELQGLCRRSGTRNAFLQIGRRALFFPCIKVRVIAQNVRTTGA